jgi:hypothetical protein
MTLDICCGSGGIIFASKAQIYSQWKVDNCKMEEMFSMLKYMLALYIEVKRKKRWRYSCFQGCEYGFGA